MELLNLVEAARAQAGRGDLEGAASSLRAASEVAERAGSARDLCWVAELQADLLADVAAVERGVTLALAHLRRPGDLASVAHLLLRTLGDRGRARDLLTNAPPPESAHDAWALGEVWLLLDEPSVAEGLLRSVEERLERAPLSFERPSEEAVTLGVAAHHWGLELRRARALELGLRLARSAEDRLELVERCVGLGLRASVIPRALAEAEGRGGQDARGRPIPLEEGLKARIIPLYRWWGDVDAAARLAPAGLRPEGLAHPIRDLPGFTPDPSGLFDHLRARLGEARMRRVAGADYGQDHDLHLAHLRAIVESGRLPPRLGWHPGEVLELRRWQEGPETDHLERAFCCATLTLGAGLEGLGNNAPILVEDALALGPPVPVLAEGLLAWAACTAPPDADELVCALWGLALLCVAGDPADPRLSTLAEALERAARDALWGEPLHLTRATRYTVRGELWRSLLARLLEPHAALPAVGRLLSLVG